MVRRKIIAGGDLGYLRVETNIAESPDFGIFCLRLDGVGDEVLTRERRVRLGVESVVEGATLTVPDTTFRWR